MVDKTRVQILNNKPVNATGKYVLYWMQQAQRTRGNQALAAAAAKANELSLPVVVVFGLMDNYPEATERQYAFMLEGLAEVKAALAEMGVLMVCRHMPPPDAALMLAKDAAVIVADRGYLRHLRQWRDRVADEAGCRVVEIETEVVVPVETASDKAEFAARTLRPKIHRHWRNYLAPLAEVKPKQSSLTMKLEGKELKSDFDLTDVEATLAKIKCDRTVTRCKRFIGGQDRGAKLLETFVGSLLAGYGESRNEPVADHSSHMSPYLQYGQMSAVDIALAGLAGRQAAKETGDADVDTFIEELIVRRELAHNYCWFTPNYDSYDALPAWARRSMEQHDKDPRAYVYSRNQLEAGDTHDPYWNAAMMEAVKTGFMHNYMRMYWGKKILEWSRTAREAFDTTLHINNRYFLDGLNANTYGNVAWIFGAHDRPWGPERPIFGLIRYMNDKGLERKFHIDKYVAKVAGM